MVFSKLPLNKNIKHDLKNLSSNMHKILEHSSYVLSFKIMQYHLLFFINFLIAEKD